jgi:uncharacterized membrane protein YeaQ/YmgE (transglycosylase-associated protein family)
MSYRVPAKPAVANVSGAGGQGIPPAYPIDTGDIMGIIAFIILGLLAGIIAKWVLPGEDPGGVIVTALIGIAGALLGGFLAGVLFDAEPLDEFFDVSTWVAAIVGSIILLVIWRAISGERPRMTA